MYAAAEQKSIEAVNNKNNYHEVNLDGIRKSLTNSASAGMRILSWPISWTW